VPSGAVAGALGDALGAGEPAEDGFDAGADGVDGGVEGEEELLELAVAVELVDGEVGVLPVASFRPESATRCWVDDAVPEGVAGVLALEDGALPPLVEPVGVLDGLELEEPDGELDAPVGLGVEACGVFGVTD